MLTAIIISYNTRQMTLDCLSALSKNLGDGAEAEIFVVDNGSTDGSGEAVRVAFPQVRVIANCQNLGFGAANNQAMREACGQSILLLNSDAFLRPGAVKAMEEVLHRRPEVAMVGPRLLNADGSLQRSCYRFPSPFRAVCEHLLLTAKWPNHSLVGDYRAWPHDAVRDVDFVVGACMLVRRTAVEQVGLFDEQFFLYSEETDWCYRFHRAGWKVTFVPDAEVVHLGGESGREQSEQVFSEFRRASERFMRKHHGIAGLWLFRFMMVVGSCVRIATFSLLAVTRPSRRAYGKRLAAQWMRILAWSVGIRGPGLSPEQG